MPFNINIPVWQEKINKCPNNKKEIHVYNDKYKLVEYFTITV
jgi:hypothetical protein